MEVEEKLELNVLKECLSEKEIEQLSFEISTKLENFFQEKFDGFITAKAVFETHRKNTDSKLKQLSEYDQIQKDELKECRAKLDLTEKYITKLQYQLNESRSQILSLNSSLRRLENENAELRKYKVVYTDENNMLHSQIGRRNTEFERLRTELTSLNMQLQSAITEKCKAYADMENIRSREMSLEFREKHFEQERDYLFQKVAGLEDELCKKTAESQNSRSEASARVLLFQTRLNQCEEELKITNGHMVEIRESNLKLQNRCEELTQKLEDQRNHELAMHASYREEVIAQTRLSDLYKGMADEANSKANEYGEAIKELQLLLEHATEQYGFLEAKHSQTISAFTSEISEKKEKINELNKELNITNELLKSVKQDRLDAAVEELAPAAAIASKMLKKGLTLTQIYTQLVETINELNLEKEENEKLRSQMEIILRELEEKAPVLLKQREDFESASAEISNLNLRVDELLIDNHRLTEHNEETKKTMDHYLKENQRLKSEQADLARQVCYLLKEVQDCRKNEYENIDTSFENKMDDFTSSQIISKKLVTFKDIEELQKNNHKLLSIVRTLSSRQEEIEKTTEEISSSKLKERLERYIGQLSEMQQAQDRQTKMLENLSKQRDMYKKMYQQLTQQALAREETFRLSNETEETYLESSLKTFEENKEIKSKGSQQTHLELEKKFTQVKDDFELYKKEKSNHEKFLNSEIERLRNEAETYSNRCCQLKVKLDTVNERFNLLQNNVASYKTQIKILEEKCTTYNSTIGKHEQSLMILKDEALSAESRLSKAEVQLENLRQEKQLLRDSESRLIKEREVLQRERQTHALLKADVESIKVSLERVHAEGKFRSEKHLDDATRECAALRRRLQEEQDRFRELALKLESQVASAKKQLAEEKILTDSLQSELMVSRSAEQNYIKKIEELDNKLKQLSSSSSKTSSDDHFRNKLKNLEAQLISSQTEAQSLMDQLKAARFQSQQYCDIAESAELQLREATEQFGNMKDKVEKNLSVANGQIVSLKTKLEKIEGKLQMLPATQSKNDSDLKKKLESSIETIQELKNELETAKNDLKLASSAAAAAEDKYAREMLLHSADLQILAKLKEEVQLKSKSATEQMMLDAASKESLTLEKSMWQERENLLLNEIKELQERLKDLDSQNTLLHDQIQEISERAVIISHQKSNVSDISSIAFKTDQSSNEESEYSKSVEQLTQVIKFLRREKDLAITKFDVLKTENVRLKSQIDLSNKQLKEIQEMSKKEQENRDINIVTAAKHSELLRKIETLNAITDSNRILREERDTLSSKINDLTDKINLLTAEIVPLREKTKNLEEKNDLLSQENNTLKNEALRWRQRANALIERANKASPEDWRRLQMERENLSKLLTSERETHVKQIEDFNSLKNEKMQLEEQLKQIQIQFKSYEDQNYKMTEDIKKLNHDLNISKSELSNKTKDFLTLQKELADKEILLADVKNKEIQIRKIAKKYKTQYEELTKNLEGQPRPENSSNNQTVFNKTSNDDESLNIQDKESQLKEESGLELRNLNNQLTLKVDELNQKMLSKQTECDNFKKEIETINKSSLEKEERAKQVLKGARTKIMQLTEYKKLCEKEIIELKEKLDLSASESESSINEYEARLTALKSQMDGRLSRLEHERSELLSEKENLQLKILQMQRHLSGSSNLNVGSTDPPTANIKPMSARAETPLASIRPMSVVVQSRTAAVLPTTAGAPLLLAPQTGQQQIVHTTETNSPTSSHVDFQPATTSRQLIVQPQLSESAESTQQEELEISDTVSTLQQQQQQQQQQQLLQQNEHQQQPDQQQKQSSEQLNLQQTQQQLHQTANQLTVALVSPRIEQQQPLPFSSEQQTIPSSSSQSVSTSQLLIGQKRPRNLDSSIVNQPDNHHENMRQDQMSSPQIKRSRQENTPSTSASTSDIEYQVPTSSQRDHDEETIHGCIEIVDCDEGNIVTQVVEEDFEQYEEMEDVSYGVDVRSDNEVEIIVGDESRNVDILIQNRPEPPQIDQQQQSEATSTAASSRELNSFTLRSPVESGAHMSRQQSQLLLSQQGYEDGGDDSIVPSTPTLFISRRSDGFGESANSVQVPQSRFTFGESSASTSVSDDQTHNNTATTTSAQEVFSSTVSDLAQLVHEGMDDTRIDLTQLEDTSTSVSVPTTPQQISPTHEQLNPVIRESPKLLSDSNLRQSQLEVKLEITSDKNSSKFQDTTVDGQNDITTESTFSQSIGTVSESKTLPKDSNVPDEGDEDVNNDNDSEIPEVVTDDRPELKENLQDIETSDSDDSKPKNSGLATTTADGTSSPVRGSTARRSVRTPFRPCRGARPTPITWENQTLSRGPLATRGHAARGSINEGQRARGTRGRRMRSKYYNY